MTADHIRRVLIIDDSPEDREVARVMLEKSKLRFHLTEAKTGEEGLRACFECEEGPPDCILLDYRLPDLDGSQMLAALGGPDSVCCPVVILTGYSSLIDGRSMLHLGAQDFIGKSWINPDSLSRSIENAMERFAMVHQLREREESSRQRAEEMEALMDSAPIAIFLSRDPECLDIRGNQMALQLYEAEPNQNLSAGSIQGEILDSIRRFFRNGHEVAPRDLPMQIAMREGRKIDTDEIEVRLPSGRISCLLCSAIPLFEGKGAVRGSIGTFMDITERKQMEQALREREARFSALFQSAGDAIGLIGEEGFLECNEATLKTFGCSTREEFLGKLPSNFSPPTQPCGGDSLVLAHEHIAKAFAQGNHHFEWEHCRPDGSVFSADIKMTRIDLMGKPVLQTILRDITARKQSEQAIRDLNASLEKKVAERTAELAATTEKAQFNEERLRHALVASSTGVVDWNRKTDDVFYLFPEEVIPGDPLPSKEAFELWKSLIHPDDLGQVLGYIAGCLTSTDDHNLEYRLRFSDDQYHWVFAKGKIVERDADGNPVRVIGTHTDIDTRKKIELQNRRLASIIEASSDLIGVSSPEGTIEYVNAAYRGLLGYKETPPENIHIRDTHPEWAYRRLMQKSIPTALREGAWQGDTVFLSQDGSEKEFSQLILAPRNPQTGEVEFLATICRDMTERRRLEDEIRDRNEALELADRRKTEFLATLAHELRNPMSPLLIAAQLLHEGSPDKTHLPWMSDLIERQVMHLSRLVDDLLDVSRITQGKIHLKRQLVDLSVLLPEAIQMVLPNIEAAHHQLSLKLPEEPIHVDGDPVRLVQVVTNLLNNAAKFTDPGGQLALTLEQRDGQAVITVNDNGRGIEPAYLNQVFELFTQVDSGPHKANGGLGVGLYLSKQLIQLHDGTITANSQGPHRGSEFVVQLPLVRGSQKATSEGPAAQAETPNVIRRILIVDDNHDAATGLELLLQQNGHDVRVAFDGHSALEYVHVFNPEVVLLDIGMPDMDGYEVCRQIRATARGKRMVICAVTGWGQPEDKQRAYEAGFDGHLTKPVKAEDILSQVNNYRGHYGPRK